MLDLLLSAALAADSTTIGGIVRNQIAYDPVRDYTLEDFLTDSTFARAWAGGEFPNGAQWFIEGRFQHHLTMRDDNVGAALDAHLEGWWDLGLGESGWDGKIGGPVTLRAGALIEKWGKLDLLPISDVLNARDFRAGLLAPFEFQKLPEPMAVFAIEGGAVRAETVLVPYASADRAFVQGSNWSFVRQGMAAEQLDEMESWLDGANQALVQPAFQALPGAIESMDPSLRRGLDAAILENELPQAFLANGEIAERVTFTGRNVDLSLMGGWLRSTQAATTLNPYLRNEVLRPERIDTDIDALAAFQAAVIGNAAVVEWPRTVVAGVDGSVLVGPIQVRAETMWTEKKVIRLPYAVATTRPSVGAGIALDYTRGSNFIATVETRYVHLFDAPDQLLLMLPDQVNVAVLVKWNILNDRILLQSGGLFDPTFMEYAAAGPALGWRVNDHVLLDVGGMMVVGSSPPPDEILNVRDDVLDGVDSLLYTGGPGSFFQQNDAVMVGISLIR